MVGLLKKVVWVYSISLDTCVLSPDLRLWLLSMVLIKSWNGAAEITDYCSIDYWYILLLCISLSLPQALSQSWNTPVVGRLFNEQMRPKQNFFVTWEAGKKKKIHSSIIISHFSNFPSVKHGGRAMIWDCCAASHQHGLPLLMGESILKIYHWFQRKI